MIKKGGIALILSVIVVAVLTIFGSFVLLRSVTEKTVTSRYSDTTKAFWVAEAGINRALGDLRVNYSTTSVGPVNIGEGVFSVTITDLSGGRKNVVSQGRIPATGTIKSERVIEAVMTKYTNVPNNFYDHAIFSGSNIVLNGNSYSVDGSVIYAGTISSNTGNITEGFSRDPTISPLAHLNFEQVKTIAIAQGNYHNSSQLNGPFPTSFWYDQAAGIPNVIFVEGPLDLSGKTQVGGFFVVGGEVTYDATLSGNVAVDGAIYTLGGFTINGGGNVLNVNGGIWSGEQSTLNGNAKIAYNETYMTAIKNLDLDTDVQIISWRDTQNPYQVTN